MVTWYQTAESTDCLHRDYLFLHSVHVYNFSFWVKIIISTSYCEIFSCNTNTSNIRETNNYLTIPQ